MTFKCINCSWEGTVLSEKPLRGKCPTCGDEVKGNAPVILEKKIDALPEKSKGRIKDFVADIMDDGKRNRSNRKKKK